MVQCYLMMRCAMVCRRIWPMRLSGVSRFDLVQGGGRCLGEVSVAMERIARRLIALPRAQKRALMLLADAICIPAALWTAILLKTGELPVGTGATPWLYAAAVLASMPVFVRLGLYRAVVRFIGPKVIVAVVSGVSASVLALAAVNLVPRRPRHCFLGDRDLLGARAAIRGWQPDHRPQPGELASGRCRSGHHLWRWLGRRPSGRRACESAASSIRWLSWTTTRHCRAAWSRASKCTRHPNLPRLIDEESVA